MIERFVKTICGCEGLWTSANIIEDAIKAVREKVGTDKVLLGLSGGVDSSVVAALLHRAIGEQLTCVFVDNGLLRLNEGEQVMHMFAQNMGVKVIRANAQDLFLGRLAGIAGLALTSMRGKMFAARLVDGVEMRLERIGRLERLVPVVEDQLAAVQDRGGARVAVAAETLARRGIRAPIALRTMSAGSRPDTARKVRERSRFFRIAQPAALSTALCRPTSSRAATMPAPGVQKAAQCAAHLGEVLWMTGQRDQAVTVWREGLRLSSDNEVLGETMKRFQVSP